VIGWGVEYGREMIIVAPNVTMARSIQGPTAFGVEVFENHAALAIWATTIPT